MPKKILILVSNDFTLDPRVQKQAASAAKFGFDTHVLAWMSSQSAQTIKTDEKKAFSVKRGIFLPNWRKKNYAMLNLKLAKNNFKLSSIIIFYFILKFLKPIYAYLKNQILIKKIKNYFIRKLQLVLVWFYQKTLTKILKPRFTQNNSLNTNHSKIIKATYNQNTPTEPKQDNIERGKIIGFGKVLRNFINSIYFYLDYYLKMNHFLIKEGIKIKPDVIHANDLDTLWAGWKIKKKTGAKLIYDAHEIWTEQGLNLPKTLLKFYGLIESFLFRKIDYFITVNESIAQELKKRYKISKIPTSIIYNIPNYQKSIFRPAQAGQIKVLYQGRYSINRGLEELLESAKYLRKGIKIYFRGTGEEEVQEKLKKLAKNWHLEEKIIFFPPIEIQKLVSGANEFDIGVVPYIPANINNYFCSPNKLYEYMMAGLALAVSNLPELSKVVKNYGLGVVFNPKNPKNIASKLNLLAADIQKLNLFKKQSLKIAIENNWEKEEQKLLQVYRKLLKS